jgi:hypothetical protein
MITITTTQLNNRGGWSGGIKREGEGRVDGRFGGEVKEEDGISYLYSQFAFATYEILI